MSAIDILFREYPGDLAWQRYIACFPEAAIPSNCECIDDEMFRVLMAKLGSPELVSAWLRRPIGALDGGCMNEVLHTPGGKQAARTLLMRLP